MVLASEPVGGRSRATELPCFLCLVEKISCGLNLIDTLVTCTLSLICVFFNRQVTSFLKSAMQMKSGADVTGKRLAAELVLALAAQRGSLCYLLEWVEVALSAAAGARPRLADHQDDHGAGVDSTGMISHTNYVQILKQMKKSAVCSKTEKSHFNK